MMLFWVVITKSLRQAQRPHTVIAERNFPPLEGAGGGRCVIVSVLELILPLTPSRGGNTSSLQKENEAIYQSVLSYLPYNNAVTCFFKNAKPNNIT